MSLHHRSAPPVESETGHAIRRLPPFTGLAYDHRVDRNAFDEMAYIGSVVHAAIRRAGLTPSGPFTSLRRGDGATLVHTVVVPVDEDAPDTLLLDDEAHLIRPGDALERRTYDGVEAAVTTFEGPPETIPERLRALRRWSVERGYRPAERHRLVILRGPMHRMPDGGRVTPETMIWELQQELRRT